MAPKASKENILERIKEQQAARRKKVFRRTIKIVGALCVLAVILAILYPYLQVVWYTSKARATDPETRKEALQWLADHEVQSSKDIFIEALKSGRSESDIAFKALQKLNDTSIVPNLTEVWKDKNVKPHGRYNALQLVAEMGGGSLIDIFIDPLAILSDKGWMSSYDFLNLHADTKTVDKLFEMLNSEDERRERAAATALRYIRKKSFISENSKIKNVLASKLVSSKIKVREEAAHALIELADEEQLPQIITALDDESPAVCRYAAMAIGYMKPEVTTKALPKLLDKLLHPDGEICTEAAFTLSKIGTAEVVPRLVQIVNDKQIESFSRERAIEVLKSISGPKALEAITGALLDSEVNVAKAAARALIRIGGKDSVSPLVDTLNRTNSYRLQNVVAYSLGMLAQKEAAPALIGAMKKGDPDLAKVAGEALLKIGVREYASELALIVQDTEAFPVSRRESLIVLSQLRTPLSVEITISMLTDKMEGIREEAGNAAMQLTKDLLAGEARDLKTSRAILEKAARGMLQKDIGQKLHKSVVEAKSFDEMNLFVYAAMRRLDEKNVYDLDLLERSIGKAKEVYWTFLMREGFVKNGVSREQIAQAANALKKYIENTFLPFEPPMSGHREMGAELKKKFGFQETRQND
jgi:HEAT repeat protein